MSTLRLSLDSLESNIQHAIENNAAIIFWHHRAQSFTYLCAEDKDRYREEMRNIRLGMSSGVVKKVKKGSNLMIKETNLFSMDIEFKETPCHAWFLLQRNGLIEDADFTPYLFTCERKRDEIVSYFQRHVK